MMFRSFLEEDNNTVDGYDQMEDLMNEIDDNDANEEEQTSAANAEYNEDDEDPLEEMTMLIAESQADFNDILQSIGIRELNESTEGVDSNTTEKRSASTMFSSIKKNIANFASTAIVKINKTKNVMIDIAMKNRAYAIKFKDEIMAGAPNVKIEGYPYSGMRGNIVNATANRITKTKAYKLAQSGSLVGANYDDSMASSDNSTILNTVGLSEIPSKMHSAKGAIVAHLRGASAKTSISMSGSALYKALTNVEDVKKINKDIVNAFKADSKTTIKAITKLESEYRKAGKKDESYRSAKATASRLASVLKKYNSLLALVRSAYQKCYRERLAQYRKLANAAIGSTHVRKKKSSEDSMDESFDFTRGFEFL